MKKPDAFDRKRKERDKASKRFLKSRDMIAPAIIALTVMLMTVGGTAAQAMIDHPESGPIGILVGGVVGLCCGAPYVVRKLSE